VIQNQNKVAQNSAEVRGHEKQPREVSEWTAMVGKAEQKRKPLLLNKFLFSEWETLVLLEKWQHTVYDETRDQCWREPGKEAGRMGQGGAGTNTISLEPHNIINIA
jgi:hypothetical protein